MLTRTFPLFRTAPVSVLAEPPAAATKQPPPAKIDGDLTYYVGYTVSAAEWAALQAEVKRHYGDDWTLYAVQNGDRWRITRLQAKPDQSETKQPDWQTWKAWLVSPDSEQILSEWWAEVRENESIGQDETRSPTYRC